MLESSRCNENFNSGLRYRTFQEELTGVAKKRYIKGPSRLGLWKVITGKCKNEGLETNR